jgi:glycosyltransferase involved in cell wall biosynthesis
VDGLDFKNPLALTGLSPVKVIVQIPALNEEKTLESVMASIPKNIPGVDQLLIIVIDDGSSDATASLAKSLGATDVIHHRTTRGLAEAFRSGVDYALTHGADILVNTDGDNQYPQERIPDLIAPIINGTADIVIGDRRTHRISHFSRPKKFLQKFGSAVVSAVSGTSIPDAASGFRAYSRTALIKLNLVTKFSYTIETIIQAGFKHLAIESVPITTNPKTRESRLFRSTADHVTRSALGIVRSLVMYRPYALFGIGGAILGIGGLIPFIRYLVLNWSSSGGQFIQSLLLGVALLIASLLAFALGVIADLIRINRQLIEDSLALQKAHQNEQSLSDNHRDS